MSLALEKPNPFLVLQTIAIFAVFACNLLNFSCQNTCSASDIAWLFASIAHCIRHPQGFLFKMGVLDLTGGTVVHIFAGCAALAGISVIK